LSTAVRQVASNREGPGSTWNRSMQNMWRRK